jgi:hypothetical protein
MLAATAIDLHASARVMPVVSAAPFRMPPKDEVRAFIAGCLLSIAFARLAALFEVDQSRRDTLTGAIGARLAWRRS